MLPRLRDRVYQGRLFVGHGPARYPLRLDNADNP